MPGRPNFSPLTHPGKSVRQTKIFNFHALRFTLGLLIMMMAGTLTGQSLDGKVFRIKSAYDNGVYRYLGVPVQNSGYQGLGIFIYKKAESLTQQWKFEAVDNDADTYRIISMILDPTYVYLDADPATMDSSSSSILHLWNELDVRNQEWIVSPAGNNTFTIETALAEGNRGRVDLNLSTDNLNKEKGVVGLHPKNDKSNQRWYLEEVREPVIPDYGDLVFETGYARIEIDKNDYPLARNTVAGEGLLQHMQAVVRLPDAYGKRYYMGTWSENVSEKDDENQEGGVVFVCEVEGGERQGKVIWADVLTNTRIEGEGGYNHPGDLVRLGNTVIIAGQNWDKAMPTEFKRGRDANDNVPQSLLFYDVSSPSSPLYMGRIEGCMKDGEMIRISNNDFSSISVGKVDSYYHLYMNGFSEDDSPSSSIECRCGEFSPDGEWEWVSNEKNNSQGPVMVDKSGSIVTMMGYHESDQIRLANLEPKVEANTYLIGTPAKKFTFPDPIPNDKTTFSMAGMADGTISALFGDAYSDDHVDIVEVMSVPTDGSRPITDLYISIGAENTAPAGYYLLPVDVNLDNDGNDIHIWYSRDPAHGDPITDIKITTDKSIPNGYQLFSCNYQEDGGYCDVTRESGGDTDIYMYFSREPSDKDPIMMVNVLHTTYEEMNDASGWNTINQDLNEDTGGGDIYFAYSRSLNFYNR